jgi:alkylated DNA nucleotide flippase Atl1
MAEERLYTVSGTSATPAERVPLKEAGFLERQHLQEWVIAHPEILGEDIRIVTFEFDRWATGTGSPTWERLDVLGLDRSGRLVVAELKRDRAPDSVMVQALNYAAMASRFRVQQLVEVYAHHRGDGADPDAAQADLNDWAPDLSDESLSPPRVVLVAEDFGPVLTNTAMFLRDRSIDLRLVRVQLYRLDNGTLALTASQLVPPPDAEQYLVGPRSLAPTVRAAQEAARRAPIPERLIAAGALRPGEQLTIVVPPYVKQDREAITRWLAEDPKRSVARWCDDPRAPVQWALDDSASPMRTLVTRIVREATGAPPQADVWGPNWFLAPDGRPLNRVADDLAGGPRAAFDWSPLHRVLERLPRGRWTTYGELATVVGTAAQPLGQHVTVCDECRHAWRILGTNGRPRPNFTWADPSDARTQEQALASEGVRFTDGIADASQRLTGAELLTLSA